MKITSAFGLIVIVTALLAYGDVGAQDCQEVGGYCNWNCGPEATCDPSCSGCAGFVCDTVQFIQPKVDLITVKAYPPYSGWEEGTRYSGTWNSNPQFDIQNYADWGAETDLGIEPDRLGFTVEVGLVSGEPNLRTLTFHSFYSRIPTFAHSEIAPSTTGVNQYSLYPSVVSYGIVNTTSGALELSDLYLNLTNDYYSPLDPARVKMTMEGTIDLSKMEATLNVVGYTYAD